MENKKTCETCAHFIQHYGKEKRGYFKVHRGHCMTPRIKPRPMETPACPRYTERDEARST